MHGRFSQGDTAWGVDVTSPVGKYKANIFGLHDMHGNVMEWCNDWYDENYYSVSSVHNPRGPADESTRSIRGGCWYLPTSDCRSAKRNGLDPSTRHFNIGFRVLREYSGN